MRHWCLARAWENGLSHPAFEGITRMLEGLVAPGFSDFSWPWPFRQSPANTHILGALHGFSPCVHRTGWLHRPLCPSKLRVTKPWSAELERRARGTPTPRHSLSLPPLQAPGTHCRRGAHGLSRRERHCVRVRTLFHLRFLPRLRSARPQSPGLPARPAQPRAHSGLRPGPRTPEVGVGSRRAEPPRPAAVQERPPGSLTQGCTAPRPRGSAPDLPAPPGEPPPASSSPAPLGTHLGRR